MCMYLYSKEHKISIELANERIDLIDETSEVCTDILILNKDNREINELTLLYPNKISEKTCFDKSHELIDKNYPKTKVYEQNGITLDIKKIEGKSKIFSIELTEPDRSDPKGYIKYSGIIATDDTEIVPCKRFSKEQHRLINKQNYSVLGIYFQTSIKPNEKRFLRITIKPEKTMWNKRKKVMLMFSTTN